MWPASAPAARPGREAGLAWDPRSPQALTWQPGQALTSGSPMAESNPAETRTSSGSNCRQGPVGRGRKEAGAEAEGRPLQRDPPNPQPPNLFHSGGERGCSGYRIPLPSCLHPPPPESHLKGQGQQHVQEGSHVVSISHPDLQPRNVRAALPGTTAGSSTPGPASRGGSGQTP